MDNSMKARLDKIGTVEKDGYFAMRPEDLGRLMTAYMHIHAGQHSIDQSATRNGMRLGQERQLKTRCTVRGKL